LTHKSSRAFEQLKAENRHPPTHIFSVQLAAPFSNDQGSVNGPLYDATKNYMSKHNSTREAHLHEDMKSYESETEEISPFSGEAAGHKHGPMLQRKVMWQDQPNAIWCKPTEQADLQQAA